MTSKLPHPPGAATRSSSGTADDAPRVEILVVDVKGSAPREPGASMTWLPGGLPPEGTIGGGNLERICLEEAERLWNDRERATAFLEVPLSARAGQCCGGMVRVFLHRRTPPAEVLICGAGHVATALARALHETPLRVVVVDERGEWADPARFPPGAEVVADDPEAFVRERADRAERTYLLVMTHRHDLDEALCRVALSRPFRWIGLIGSRTKWLRFRQRLAARGFTPDELARIQCPIGDPALGRTPAEIAVGVAAQVLAARDRGADVRKDSARAGDGAEAARAGGARAALILAGGASTRMGGRWKGGLAPGGEPLVLAHARAFEAAGAETWRAIYPESARDEAERLVPPGRRAPNPSPAAPMFASIQLGLRELLRERPDLDSIALAPVDTLPLDPDLIAALWDLHETRGARATRPRVPAAEAAGEGEGVEGSERHGHPLIVDQRLFAPILAADPATARLDYLVRDLAPEHRAELELPGARTLVNLNTPEDHARVASRSGTT